MKTVIVQAKVGLFSATELSWNLLRGGIFRNRRFSLIS